jgi:hypothetical protein
MSFIVMLKLALVTGNPTLPELASVRAYRPWLPPGVWISFFQDTRRVKFNIFTRQVSKELARLTSRFVFLLADPEFYSHWASDYLHPCCPCLMRLDDDSSFVLFAPWYNYVTIMWMCSSLVIIQHSFVLVVLMNLLVFID